MTVSILDIADAVKTELNDAAFKAALTAAGLPATYTAVRTQDTQRTLEEVDALTVIVMAASRFDDANVARGLTQVDHEIHVGLMDKVDTSDDDATGLLIQLVESVARHFRRFSASGFTCIQTAVPELWRQDDFLELNQFTGVVRLTFRGIE